MGEFERAAVDVHPHDEQLAVELEAVRLGALLLNPALPARLEDEVDRLRDLPMRTASECTVASFRARRELAAGRTVAAADLAERVVTHPAVIGTAGWALANTTMCLVAAERYDVMERELTNLIRLGERRGMPILLTAGGWMRALVRHRRGDLRGAEADGRAAAAVREQMYGLDARSSPTVMALVEALTDQGKLAEADAVVADLRLDPALGTTLTAIGPLIARGRFRAATGDLAGARHDLTEALRCLDAARLLYPGEHDARVALVPSCSLRVKASTDARWPRKPSPPPVLQAARGHLEAHCACPVSPAAVSPVSTYSARRSTPSPGPPACGGGPRH